MTKRNKILEIFRRKSTNGGGVWTGHPSDEFTRIFTEKYGLENDREAVYRYLNDDCRWFTADYCYHHPEGAPMFDTGYGIKKEHTLSSEGCFANVTSIAEIDKYPWPDAKYCDFTDLYKRIEEHSDKIVFTGMWSPFFHFAADFFGMENFFVNMHLEPKLVEAVVEHVVDFFVAANEKLYEGLGDRADTLFIGNDFGTQLDLFISPEQFRQFVLPSFKRLIAVAKKHNKIVMLHSCGSVYRIIPDLIEAGVDVLHPIQAQAVGMDAKSLSQYKNDLAFLGGIDAQSFFVNATPQQVKDEVYRVRELLGPNLVVSPSHEEILPNVPPENVIAMMEAGRE